VLDFILEYNFRNIIKTLKKHNEAHLFWKNVKIPGWIGFEDVVFFFFFFDELNSQKINGSVLEIGAFLGKTSILLDRLMLPSDVLHVCDVFEEQNQIADLENLNEVHEYYKKLVPTRALFDQNFSLYGKKSPIIHQCESEFLEKELIDRSFKFIHIDAAHTFTAVNKDVNISLAKICKNGIIVMDDYRNYGALGVSQVFWSVIIEKKLKLILLTEAKAYFSFGSENTFLKDLEKFLEKNSIDFYKESINGEFFIRNKYKLSPQRFLILKLFFPTKAYMLISRIKSKCIRFLVDL
jgi:hypothetical protein